MIDDIVDNVIPLVDPNVVEDEFVTDEYERGYELGLQKVDEINAALQGEFVGFHPDFLDGLYDAIVENINL